MKNAVYTVILRHRIHARCTAHTVSPCIDRADEGGIGEKYNTLYTGVRRMGALLFFWAVHKNLTIPYACVESDFIFLCYTIGKKFKQRKDS